MLVMFATARRIIFATGLAVGLSLGTMLGAGLAKSDPAPATNEDSPGFSCVDDGNKICGPGNAQGAPAGLYDDGGVLVFTWDQLLTLGIVRTI